MADIRHSTESGCTVVWLRGEHDLSTVTSLSEELATATAADEADVVLDLSELRFMDASTVGVIVQTAATLRAQSRRLGLRHPPAFVHRVLDLCGIAGLVEPADVPSLALPDPGGALGSWVAVPPTEPATSHASRESRAVAEDPDPVPTGRR